MAVLDPNKERQAEVVVHSSTRVCKRNKRDRVVGRAPALGERRKGDDQDPKSSAQVDNTKGQGGLELEVDPKRAADGGMIGVGDDADGTSWGEMSTACSDCRCTSGSSWAVPSRENLAEEGQGSVLVLEQEEGRDIRSLNRRSPGDRNGDEVAVAVAEEVEVAERPKFDENSEAGVVLLSVEA